MLNKKKEQRPVIIDLIDQFREKHIYPSLDLNSDSEQA